MLFETLIPINLCRTPKTSNSNDGGSISSFQDSPAAGGGSHTIQRRKSVKMISNKEVTTAWIILTWQLFAIQMYFMSSQAIGVEELGLTKASITSLFATALSIHICIMLVAIRVSLSLPPFYPLSNFKKKTEKKLKI